MRKKLIAGNWKMYKNIEEAKELTEGILSGVRNIKNIDIVICPPFTALLEVSRIIKDTNIELGAQDVFYKSEGAYTGCISPNQLIDVGCAYVIIGHSERREHIKESDGVINLKINAALQAGLKVILCVGEKLEAREEGNTEKIVKSQVENDLINIPKEAIKNLVIAYEPVWAIGTGRTAHPEDAEYVIKLIRGLIQEKYDKEVSDNIRILYGGSVKPDNIAGFMQKENIDGALVGGASLEAATFVKIIENSLFTG